MILEPDVSLADDENLLARRAGFRLLRLLTPRVKTLWYLSNITGTGVAPSDGEGDHDGQQPNRLPRRPELKWRAVARSPRECRVQEGVPDQGRSRECREGARARGGTLTGEGAQ